MHGPLKVKFVEIQSTPHVILHVMIPIYTYVRNMTVHASYLAVVSRHICTDFA
jgi:hypothetical protein